jgi:hypothetical protein
MKNNKETYKRVYNIQKDTFNDNSKKWGIEKEEIEDLFSEFWTEFETGKTKSIKEFLISRKYKEKIE